jgi:Tfp pilus assembly protein PilF
MRPDNRGDRVRLADLWLYLAQAEDVRGGDTREAFQACLEQWTRLIALGHDPKVALYNRGAAHVDLGRAHLLRGEDALPHFELAERDLRKVLELDAANPRVWCSLASALHSQGQARRRRGEEADAWYLRSIEAAARALKIDPRFKRAHLRRASAYLSLGMGQRARGESEVEALRKAVSACDEAVALAPGDAACLEERGHLRLNLAEALRRKGKNPRSAYLEAFADVRDALQKDASFWRAWTNMGVIQQRFGNVEKAIAAYEAVLKIRKPPPGDVVNNLAVARKTAALPPWARFLKAGRNS